MTTAVEKIAKSLTRTLYYSLSLEGKRDLVEELKARLTHEQRQEFNSLMGVES